MTSTKKSDRLMNQEIAHWPEVKYPPPKHNWLDPKRFVGKSFTLRPTLPDSINNHVAVTSGLSAARMVMESKVASRTAWCWYVTGPWPSCRSGS
jgi:hypothetical protein